jgi:hypothetical protein
MSSSRRDAGLVGVEFDAAVVEEANEPIPMVQAVADDFRNDELRRDARELLFERWRPAPSSTCRAAT